MKLLVGLGNPGAKYAKTRHNAGFLVLDKIAEHMEISLDRKMFDSFYGEGQLFEQPVILVKPQTYMNLSGTSVRRWMQFYKLKSSDVIVLHDDIDMMNLTVKMKKGGGHGGNNGIRSIIDETGQSDFFRIKLGIGRPERVGEEKDESVTGWVLGSFDEDQIAKLKSDMFNETMLRLREIFLQGLQKKSKGDAHA